MLKRRATLKRWLLKCPTLLEHPNHSTHQNGLEQSWISNQNSFTQIWFGSLLKPNLFGVYSYKYLITTLWGLEIILKILEIRKKISNLLRSSYWRERLKYHTILNLSVKDSIFESWVEDLYPFNEAKVTH